MPTLRDVSWAGGGGGRPSPLRGPQHVRASPAPRAAPSGATPGRAQPQQRAGESLSGGGCPAERLDPGSPWAWSRLSGPFRSECGSPFGSAARRAGSAEPRSGGADVRPAGGRAPASRECAEPPARPLRAPGGAGPQAGPARAGRGAPEPRASRGRSSASRKHPGAAEGAGAGREEEAGFKRTAVTPHKRPPEAAGAAGTGLADPARTGPRGGGGVCPPPAATALPFGFPGSLGSWRLTNMAGAGAPAGGRAAGTF